MEAVDDGVGCLVSTEFTAGAADGVTAETFAATGEFCGDSGDANVGDFLLRKRVAVPKSVPTITAMMAAIFQ